MPKFSEVSAGLLFSLLLMMVFVTVQAETPSIDGLREQLFARYRNGELAFDAMMQESKTLDAQRRQVVLKDWGIVEAPVTGSDQPYRTGTDPQSAEGRGIFSDEDIACSTKACVSRIKAKLKARKLLLAEKEFLIAIPELDIKLWKPELKIPPFSNRKAYLKYARSIAKEPEYALGVAKNGPSREPLETVLELLSKTSKEVTEPVSHWGSEYQRYDHMIQLTKTAERSLNAVGLCDKRQPMAPICQSLHKIRRMQISPVEAGWMSVGAGPQQAEVLLVTQRNMLLKLVTSATQKALRDLTERLDNLTDDRAVDPALAASTYRMAVRLGVLRETYGALALEPVLGSDEQQADLSTMLYSASMALDPALARH